jgi:hypothetical protein
MAIDLGFKGMQKDFKHTAFPFSDNAEKNYDLLDKEIEFNKKFKSIRTIIENIIAHVKMWKICKYTYRSYPGNDLLGIQEEHHKLWVIASDLVNEFVPLLKQPIDEDE